MNKIILAFACLACAGQGRRIQSSIQSLSPLDSQEVVDAIPQSLAQMGLSDNETTETAEPATNQTAEPAPAPVPAPAPPPPPPPPPPAPVPAPAPESSNFLTSLWKNKDVQRVLTLLAIIAIGKTLQARFPDKEANAIQKMLLQFLVPATLFKGLSKEVIKTSHLAYIGGGFCVVLMRFFSAGIVSYAVMGSSTQQKMQEYKRTALFEISTMASALSVLPFLAEFVGPQYVGLGGMVDLPMKLYMLIIMPVLLKAMGESSGANESGGGGGKALGILTQLVKDPITMSLVCGIAFAMTTGGGGTAALGFVGKALDALAGAQTPVLFLLIGLKLKFDSQTPLYCIVLLLATQGVLLLIVWVALLILPVSDTIAKFIILFAQGAPSVVGMGVITSAASSGVKGYSKEFAFDIVGMAFPISSFMQCFAGIMGGAYQSALPIVAIVLIGVAAGLRVVFSAKFLEA